MAELDERYQVSANVVAREIADGLMLVNVQTGAAFKLNQVGALVWRSLDRVNDVPSIVTELERQYQVGSERLRYDVESLLRDLRTQGLIQPVTHPPAARASIDDPRPR